MRESCCTQLKTALPESSQITYSSSCSSGVDAATDARTHGKLAGPHRSSRPNYNTPPSFSQPSRRPSFCAATPCRESLTAWAVAAKARAHARPSHQRTLPPCCAAINCLSFPTALESAPVPPPGPTASDVVLPFACTMPHLARGSMWARTGY